MMNDKPASSQYILLFRGNQWDKGLSPQQLQAVMSDWMAWYERHEATGVVKGGNPLESEGKLVTGRKGQNVADGPFAESKEAIGGYFLLEVDNYDDALAVAKECPALEYGMVVEVRPVAQQCPASRRAEMQATATV